MSSGALAHKGQRNEHTRQEKLRDLFASGVRAILVIIFIILGFTLAFLGWHYLAPEKYWWINDDNLDTIRTVVFSGTIFAFLGLYVRDRI